MTGVRRIRVNASALHGQDKPPPSVTTEQLECLRQVQQRLVAEIFDSAPGYMTIASGLTAIGASFGSGFTTVRRFPFFLAVM